MSNQKRKYKGTRAKRGPSKNNNTQRNNKKNTEDQFHIISTAVAAGGGEHVSVEMPTTMMDIKYLTTEEDIQNNHDMWRNAGPPLGNVTNNEGTSSAAHTIPQDSQSTSRGAAELERNTIILLTQLNYLDLWGNVPADISEMALGRIMRFFNF